MESTFRRYELRAASQDHHRRHRHLFGSNSRCYTLILDYTGKPNFGFTDVKHISWYVLSHRTHHLQQFCEQLDAASDWAGCKTELQQMPPSMKRAKVSAYPWPALAVGNAPNEVSNSGDAMNRDGGPPVLRVQLLGSIPTARLGRAGKRAECAHE